VALIDYDSADSYAEETILEFLKEDLERVNEDLKRLPKLGVIYKTLAQALEAEPLSELGGEVIARADQLAYIKKLLVEVKALLPKIRKEVAALLKLDRIDGTPIEAFEALPTVVPLCELGKELERVVVKLKEQGDDFSVSIDDYITSECGVYEKIENNAPSFSVDELSGDVLVAGLLAGYMVDVQDTFPEEDEELEEDEP
jgi:hypothetical protein